MNQRSELGLCLLGTAVGLAVDMAQAPFMLGSLCLGSASLGSAVSLDLWMMPYSHFGMLLGLAICSWPRRKLAGPDVWRHAASRMGYAIAMLLGMLSAEMLAMSLPIAQHGFTVMAAAMVIGMIGAAYACAFASARMTELANSFSVRATVPGARRGLVF
jgi:hypothetical protein